MRANRCDWPPRLVTVPGLHGSGPAHWQTWLERQFAYSIRIEQAMWDEPDLERWREALERRLEHERGPFVIAAHSFGCLVAAHALGHGLRNVAGALLVAPASPVRFGVGLALWRERLPIASIVVGSETDPWLPAAGARALAESWGAAFLNLGEAGHVNPASGFGPWPRAKYLVDTLAHWAAPRHLARGHECRSSSGGATVQPEPMLATETLSR
ncbi:alpha/beta hydrolase [Trinickia caryophylli]|nr:alpha/beta hydrolase [Trinickia caryophylli]WQE13816.1 alpha/beta hydrolase [Trinickia caryophylli]